jgi:hypothetical protein
MTAATPLPGQVVWGPDPDLRAAHGPEGSSNWGTDGDAVFVIGTVLIGAPGPSSASTQTPV